MYYTKYSSIKLCFILGANQLYMYYVRYYSSIPCILPGHIQLHHVLYRVLFHYTMCFGYNKKKRMKPYGIWFGGLFRGRIRR